ncbi:Monocarboxylate transporter 2 [Holothuria leucospilota]|uniref:Monocarboxylate transporter 2 n=1 Tax=Holothuria leucospilota TaxID=206669 RepID=A0A9Q1CSU2_HOLLE|nr:Monocarboxylate transporter 2 [Holothuria leucospilota]
MDKVIVFWEWCIRMFLLNGTLKSNGVILSDIVQRLRSTNSMVGWAFSLQQGVSYMISPFAALLLGIFTRRQLAVSGSCLVGLSYVFFGLYLNSTWQLFFVYIETGVGFGCHLVGGYFSFVEHFYDNIPTIISATTLFNFIGLALLPLVLQYFKTSFGLSQGLVLFGGVLGNLVFSAFAVTIPVRKGKQEKTLNITNADQDKHCPYIKREVEEKDTEKLNEEECVPNLFRSWSTLFKQENAAIIIALDSLMFYIFISWGLFLVSVGTCAGFRSEQAVLLSTAGGIGGFFGKLIAVGLFHIKKMNAYTSSMIPLFCNSVSLLTCSLVKDIYVMLICTCVTGICIGLNTSGLFGLLSTTVCKYHYRQASVILWVVEGVMVQLGGLVSGLISDFMGCASYVFLFNSILSIAGLPLVFIWACRKRPQKENNP